MKRLISMLTSFVIWLALGGSAVAALAQAPGYANSAENNTFTIYLTALTFALGLGFIALYMFIFRNERNGKFSRNFIISTVTKGVSFPLRVIDTHRRLSDAFRKSVKSSLEVELSWTPSHSTRPTLETSSRKGPKIETYDVKITDIRSSRRSQNVGYVES
jgi:hypothetical protein